MEMWGQRHHSALQARKRKEVVKEGPWALPPICALLFPDYLRGQADHVWCGAHSVSLPVVSSHLRLPNQISPLPLSYIC